MSGFVQSMTLVAAIAGQPTRRKGDQKTASLFCKAVEWGTMPSLEPRQFRNIMGHFATGVTVVTTDVGGEVRGLTVNSLTSVSLDPLLVLWCLDKKTRLAEHLSDMTGYGISILASPQRDLSSYFAGQIKDGSVPVFAFEPMAGGPRIAGCVAALGCRLERVDEGGDHWILLGRVEELYLSEAAHDPLVWFGGRYRGLSALA